MKTYIRIEYEEFTLLNVRVVKLISSFETFDDALKFVLTLDNVGIKEIIVKFDKNLFKINRSMKQPVISFILDLFNFIDDFE